MSRVLPIGVFLVVVGCNEVVLPDLPSGSVSSDVCGNNVVEGSEACDDGNLNDNDGCLNSCALASCGDGIVRVDVDSQSEGFEACDDGNALNTDGCLATCRLPGCGDGFLRNDLDPSDPNYEQCDDGNLDPSDGCHQCRVGCGNGVQEAGEACDDGNAVDEDACTNSCALAICGDGIRRADVEAGDEAYEECDDGDSDDDDGCTRECQFPRCGDGIVRSDLEDESDPNYEQCDDGNEDNTDGCTTECTLAHCGDGYRRVDIGGGREGFEECDDGNEVATDECTNDCTLRRCGDGITAPLHEGCDDGNENEDDTCLSNCKLPTCGNGEVDGAEPCDDGNDDDTDACTNMCLEARCGDGIKRLDVASDHPRYEACDDADMDDADGCLNTCRLAACGDGIVRRDLERRMPGFEDCDPEDPQTAEGCINCRRGCGDGVVDGENGENCDDGNDDDADGCRNDCQLAGCGDGVQRIDLAPGETNYEACDDGNAISGDGCSARCDFVEVTDVWAALNTTCATFGDGSARCWGSGDDGLKNWVSGQRNVQRAILLNFNIACVLRLNEQVDCLTFYQSQPTEVTLVNSNQEPIRGLIELNGHRDVLCTLARDGIVYCKPVGELWVRGPGFLVINPVETNSRYLALDMNVNGACGLTVNDRSVECWGYRDTTFRRRHTQIPNSLGTHAFAVSYDGIVMVDAMGVRGLASNGSLPLSEASCGSTTSEYNAWGESVPWEVLSRGVHSTCGISQTGGVYCVGYRAGSPWQGPGPCRSEQHYMPQRVALPNDEAAVQITAGDAHYCVRSDQGAMYCWGRNIQGQIGLGDRTAVTPIRVAP